VAVLETYDFGSSFIELGEGGMGIALFGLPVPPCPPCPPFPPTPSIPIVQLNPLVSIASEVDFGTDFDFLSDLNPNLSMVSGLAVLGQDILHRLETPRGGLFYDPDYGTDVRSYLNGKITGQVLSRMQAEVEAELGKDERFLTTSAKFQFVPQTNTLTLNLAVVTAQGPFALVIEITNLTITLLSLQAQGTG
jgi:phage baseplate assembly protein W